METRSEIGVKRAVLHLHVIDEFSAEEIAHLTGLPKERIEKYLEARSGSDWEQFCLRTEKAQDMKWKRKEAEMEAEAAKTAEREKVAAGE